MYISEHYAVYRWNKLCITYALDDDVFIGYVGFFNTNSMLMLM